MRTTVICTVLILFACGQKRAEVQSYTLVDKRDSGSTHSVIPYIQDSGKHEKSILQWLNEDTVDLPFRYEDSITGIGMITIADTVDTYHTIFRLYDMNEKEVGSIEWQDSGVITRYKGKVYGKDERSPVCPRLLITNPDYFRLVFDCIKITPKYYVVTIGNGETVMLKKNVGYVLNTPENFVDQQAALGFDFNRMSNPLRINPDDHAAIIENNLLSKYVIWRAGKVSMKGDWIEVVIGDTNEKGWIRWRKGNQILVRLYYVC